MLSGEIMVSCLSVSFIKDIVIACTFMRYLSYEPGETRFFGGHLAFLLGVNHSQYTSVLQILTLLIGMQCATRFTRKTHLLYFDSNVKHCPKQSQDFFYQHRKSPM